MAAITRTYQVWNLAGELITTQDQLDKKIVCAVDHGFWLLVKRGDEVMAYEKWQGTIYKRCSMPLKMAGLEGIVDELFGKGG